MLINHTDIRHIANAKLCMCLISSALHGLSPVADIYIDRTIHMNIVIKADCTVINICVVTHDADGNHGNQCRRIPVAVSNHRKAEIFNHRINNIHGHILELFKISISVAAVTAVIIP